MAITSRSTKATSGVMSKYSSPTLRPPMMRGLVVGRERLVVHPPVQSRKIGQVREQARPANADRIEQANLDVRMRIEVGENRIEAGRVVVVEQEPHPHAAVGCPAQAP